MRQQIWNGRTSVALLVVAVWATCGATYGQTDRANLYDSGEYDAHGEIERLRERLDAYDRDLRGMRSAIRQTIQRLPSAGENYFEANWNSSLLENTDGEPVEIPIIETPTHKIGGRMYFDHLMAHQSSLNRSVANGPGDLENRTHFDTVRITMSGDVYENVSYKVDIAFMEQADIRAKDIYLGVHLLPLVGNVKLGHFKEPFSLDQLTSSRFITFMERNVADMFTPMRNAGFMAYNDVGNNENVTWYAGLFRSEIDDDPVDAQADSADWALTGRLAWNPIYDEPSGGRYLVHLGVAGSHRRYGDGGVSYANDVGIDLAGSLLNTGTIAVDEVNLLGLEAAAVWGPLHVQAEYIHSDAQLTAGGGADLEGYYFQAGWFLTGEHRGYKRSSKAFDRTKVIEPFFRVRTAEGVCGGKGAWEVAYRYAKGDLIDGGVAGGVLQSHTVGVNWYLNNYTRIMFNYVYVTDYFTPVSTSPGGTANGFGMRFQVDF